MRNLIFDELVKSSDILFFVIPAKAGIQKIRVVSAAADFHGSDGIF
jgi:hypothetical protein